MTKEVLDVIERSIALLIAVSGGTVVFIKMFDWLKARDKEKSVGATAIADFMSKFLKYDKDISHLQLSDENQDEQIKRLQSDRDEMMRTLINYLRK